MRCPKCGYISFDNVEKCLKCKRNIANASKQFQGSVFNVATPVFLKLTADEEETEFGEMAVGEFGDTAEEDFDIVDPDLDILVGEDDEGSAETGDIQLSLEDEDDDGADDDLAGLADLDEIGGELSEIEAFAEDEIEAVEDEDISLDLGALEEAVADEPESDIPTMEMPEELADLSDLSPPDKAEAKVALQPEEPEESEDDLDFAGLGDILADSPAEPEPKKETVLSLDMDEDLNFELDLGGLSIHDDNK